MSEYPFGDPSSEFLVALGSMSAHAGSRTRVTSMGGLCDAATLHALLSEIATGQAPVHIYEVTASGVGESTFEAGASSFC